MAKTTTRLTGQICFSKEFGDCSLSRLDAWSLGCRPHLPSWSLVMATFVCQLTERERVQDKQFDFKLTLHWCSFNHMEGPHSPAQAGNVVSGYIVGSREMQSSELEHHPAVCHTPRLILWSTISLPKPQKNSRGKKNISGQSHAWKEIKI